MHENLVLVLIPLERNSVNLIQLELKELAYFTVFYTLIGNEQGEDYSRRR